ncbi:MAG: arsenite methyltransferase [Ilumatobacter sp.]|nr:arsenite methyltransferase [Ilumatobacter sp.]
MATPDTRTVKSAIVDRYGARAAAQQADPGSCCGDSETSCCAPTPTGPQVFSTGLYAAEHLAGVPLTAELASLGCANPHALADLAPGQTVLDLGSGAGLDVIIAAKRVGPSGRALGVDLTPEMVALAEQNARDAGISNVEFRVGDIEDLPYADRSVDVVMSNCVLNLASTKRDVFDEIARVLRPGGRIAVADVVIDGELPATELAATLRADLFAWGSCIAGALTVSEFSTFLTDHGFEHVDVDIVRRHTADELLPPPRPAWMDAADPGELRELMSHYASAFVRAARAER